MWSCLRVLITRPAHRTVAYASARTDDRTGCKSARARRGNRELQLSCSPASHFDGGGVRTSAFLDRAARRFGGGTTAPRPPRERGSIPCPETSGETRISRATGPRRAYSAFRHRVGPPPAPERRRRRRRLVGKDKPARKREREGSERKASPHRERAITTTLRVILNLTAVRFLMLPGDTVGMPLGKVPRAEKEKCPPSRTCEAQRKGRRTVFIFLNS